MSKLTVGRQRGQALTEFIVIALALVPLAIAHDIVLQRRITALENVPVVSYLVLDGKCKGCKAKISPRHPIIELLSGLLAAYTDWLYGSGSHA